ncbi:cyclic nucleotide-binding-like protein [Phlyctochytrium arcticum]|nr:cyclic nucleotide-binding-like protein [Phlyctochytrium arcticum]
MQAISRHHSVIGGGLGTAAAVVPATPTPAAAPPPLRRRTTTHAGVDARRLGSLAQDHSDQEASVAILQKSRFERTAEDVKVLFKFLRKIKAFAKVSDFILEQLCKVGYYQSYAADRAVFRQGEVGTAWYILLHGSVVVQVSQTGRIEDSVPVTKLYAGEGFGDLALTNDKPRTASIITAEPCEVVYIEKEDYKVVYFIHEKEMKEKMMFLRKVPLFHDWAAPSLRSIAQYINWRKHLPGTVIVEEGSDVEEFFIIRSGTCTAHRTLPPSITEALNVSPKHASVQVGMIHSLQYFGTEGVVGDGNLPPPTPARYTIRASAEGIVQTAVMTVFDAKTNFRGAVEELRFPGHSDERELLKIYEGNIAQRKWYRTRKAVIKELAKEWTGDPLAGQSSGPWRVFHDEELEGSTPTWRW